MSANSDFTTPKGKIEFGVTCPRCGDLGERLADKPPNQYETLEWNAATICFVCNTHFEFKILYQKKNENQYSVSTEVIKETIVK